VAVDVEAHVFAVEAQRQVGPDVHFERFGVDRLVDEFVFVDDVAFGLALFVEADVEGVAARAFLEEDRFGFARALRFHPGLDREGFAELQVSGVGGRGAGFF
jgi:hypothetical protein